MTVFKRPATKNYFASKRDWMQDPRLKNSSKGLLATMLSMPEDWKFSQKDLQNRTPDGEDSNRSSMKDLAKFGYLVKYPRIRLKNGTLSEQEYDVWDEPQIDIELSDKQISKIFSNFYSDQDYQEIYKIKISYPERDLSVQDKPVQINPVLQEKQGTNPSDKENNNNFVVDPSDCVVFPSLNKLKIPHDLKIRLSKSHDEQKVNKLVERVLKWDKRSGDGVACNTILNSWDTWSDEATLKDRDKQNKAKMDDLMLDVEKRKERALKLAGEYPELLLTVNDTNICRKEGKGFLTVGFADEIFDGYLDLMESQMRNG